MTVGAPLARLMIGKPPERKPAAAAAAPDASAPPTQADAEVAAKIAEFHAAKQAHYEKHVKR